MKGGSWIRAERRWSIYLRDGMRRGPHCVYCLRDLEAILDKGGFLTLDHIKPVSLGGDHDDWNLITSCWECNVDRGVQTISDFARALGMPRSTLLSRIHERRNRGDEITASAAYYREAARVLLGGYPGVPRAEIVSQNDWNAKRHFERRDPTAAAEYDYLIEQMSLVCRTCGQPHEGARHTEEIPF